MPPLAIELDRVSKRYSVGDRPGLLSWPRRGSRERDVHWAVRDVSLQVAPGESVGLIGHNGAGKTTLLRLLAGITRASAGRVRTSGRLASLINLGAGFHPELSGRENVELNGVILGLSRREVLARFDEIVEFADLGPYIDTPLKRYSAGMVARLGFAVAAFVDPDVLLVDEVLSVGDISFQDRSIRKMLSFRDSGQAVLFVSHNLSAVEMMCQRTVWLDHGTVRLAGPTAEVVRAYLDAVDEGLLREEEGYKPSDEDPLLDGAPERTRVSAGETAEHGATVEQAAGEGPTAEPTLSQRHRALAASGGADSLEKAIKPSGTNQGHDAQPRAGADQDLDAAPTQAGDQDVNMAPTRAGDRDIDAAPTVLEQQNVNAAPIQAAQQEGEAARTHRIREQVEAGRTDGIREQGETGGTDGIREKGEAARTYGIREQGEAGGTDATARDDAHGLGTGTRATREGERHTSDVDGHSAADALAITRVSVGDRDGHTTNDFEFGAQLRVSVRALARQAVREVRCTLTVRGDYGPLFSAISDVFPTWDTGAHEVICVFDELPLLPGLYRLEVELDHAAAPTWDKPRSISAFRIVTDLAEYGSDSVVGATKSRGGFLAVGYDWTLRTPGGEQRLPGLRTPRNMTASRRP